MRLVLICDFSDGCTYSCEATYPILHESVSSAEKEFDMLVQTSRNSKDGSFVFCGETFSASDFIWGGDYYRPRIITVEEWFDCVESIK